MPEHIKHALVTGGSGAIGAAIARALAQSGCLVSVHANSHLDKAQEVVDQIAATGGRARAVQFDVRDRKQTRHVLETLSAQQPIQIVVNNAGFHADGVFPALSEQAWDDVLDVNLGGFFNVTQPLIMPMIRARWGRIINISSVAALTGNRGQVNYSAAKGALHSATKSLALELASRSITVNAVAPGIITSAMSAGSFDEKTIAQLVPMKRAGTPEEVADLVSFLSSDKAAYITGQIISINGGII
jgi:3-oxoacyl-[acyl-carrier protein] reductase